jgi:hypothetical protein
MATMGHPAEDRYTLYKEVAAEWRDMSMVLVTGIGFVGVEEIAALPESS